MLVIATAHVRWGASEAGRLGEIQALAEWAARRAERTPQPTSLVLTGDLNVPDVTSPLYRALIRRGAPERPVILTAGDLSLDPLSHRVRRGESDISLTPREFSLLQYLMQHVGTAVTKSEILDGVWDSAFDGDHNVVEVYVRYLRRKLDIPFNRQSIETIRGVGYRLDSAGG